MYIQGRSLFESSLHVHVIQIWFMETAKAMGMGPEFMKTNQTSRLHSTVNNLWIFF